MMSSPKDLPEVEDTDEDWAQCITLGNRVMNYAEEKELTPTQIVDYLSVFLTYLIVDTEMLVNWKETDPDKRMELLFDTMRDLTSKIKLETDIPSKVVH